MVFGVVEDWGEPGTGDKVLFSGQLDIDEIEPPYCVDEDVIEHMDWWFDWTWPPKWHPDFGWVELVSGNVQVGP